MIGKIITGQDGIPLARIVAAIEVILRVDPKSDPGTVQAFLDEMIEGHRDHIIGVCDNRDLFKLCKVESTDFKQVRDALNLGCGRGDPRAVDWAVASFFDVADASNVPEVFVTCSLGRRLQHERESTIALTIGVADSTCWQDMHRRASALADRWPKIWRWITVGSRFCSLDYNGFHMAHQAIYRVAKRMPCVDIGDTLGIHTAYWAKKLRTVSWETFVCPELAGHCGASHSGTFHEVEVSRLAHGGIAVRVRGKPDEEMSSRSAMKGYFQADRSLRGVRSLDEVVFLPPWNSDSSREWLDRWCELSPRSDTLNPQISTRMNKSA